MKLTEHQAIVIMGFTGVATVDFGKFHGDVEKRLGRPVWTHQFPSIMGEIKEAYRQDFMAILPEKAK